MKFLLYVVIFFNSILIINGKLFSSEESFAVVVRVSDGDSIIVRNYNQDLQKIRLAGIDAPELNQPHGSSSKIVLRTLVLHKTVRIRKISTDRYNRTVGIVFFEGEDINMQMIMKGAAWAYKKYLKVLPDSKNSTYLEAEKNARSKTLGLWKNDNSIPPWSWRKKYKQR